jgi:hypothetical protein
MQSAVHQHQGKAKCQNADGDTHQHEERSNELESDAPPIALPLIRGSPAVDWGRRS